MINPLSSGAASDARSGTLRRDAPEEIPLFSYAAPEDGWLKRLVIQAIEHLTGQPRLKRMFEHHRANPREGESFWAAAVRYLQLDIRTDETQLAALPRTGPLVLVANHPFGVLDGIIISHLISRVRPDFKILTNAVLYRAPEIRPWLLPVDFSGTPEATATNLASRAAARQTLAQDGTVIVFPGGGVATAATLFGPATDLPWQPFAAQLVMASRATVVPVYFEGQNSRLFQIASHVSMTLRLSLLFKETAARIGTTQIVRIGAPIPFDDLAHISDRRALADELRRRTYALGGIESQNILSLYQ